MSKSKQGKKTRQSFQPRSPFLLEWYLFLFIRLGMKETIPGRGLVEKTINSSFVYLMSSYFSNACLI